MFGRTLANQCNPQPVDPLYSCGASQADYADLVLTVNLNNVETSKTNEDIKEKNLFHKSGDLTSSIDSFAYLPFYEIDTGTVG